MSARGRDAINFRRMTSSDIDAILVLVEKNHCGKNSRYL